MTVTEQPQFHAEIDREARRQLVRAQAPGLNGIDFVEVLSNHRGSPGYVVGVPQQRTLLVHLLQGPVPTEWRAGVVRVVGGVRQDSSLNPVRVEWAYSADLITAAGGAPLDGVTDADRVLIESVPASIRANALVVRTTSPGDWSAYLVQLTGSGGDGVPWVIDEPLASASFSFTVDCPSDLDCHREPMARPGSDAFMAADYLARDYAQLRTRLIDRLATLLPGWTDRNPADPMVMLAELGAAVGDWYAVRQDAIAAEAYLSTARRRTSIRRHARLLGYSVHEGCSARTLLAFSTPGSSGPVSLLAGTPVADLPANSSIDAIDSGGTVFETMMSLTVRAERNALPLHAWGAKNYSLPAGATAAFVRSDAGADPELRAGDLLILAEQPAGGGPREGDPGQRFAVRLTADARRHEDHLRPNAPVPVWEIRWSADDALPAPLTVSDDDDAPRAVALANVVVADHGASIAGERLVLPSRRSGLPVRPRLARGDLSWTDRQLGATASAAGLLAPDPRRAEAALKLHDGTRLWTAQRDLLASGRLDAHVVVEGEPGRAARLRFGDGVNGRAPTGTNMRVSYRVGGGTGGNIAAHTLTHVLPRPDGVSAHALTGIELWNPLAGLGGIDPEPAEQVRQHAPAAIRTQRRAVTPSDYAQVAEQHPGIQRAVARRRWTGSWYAQEIVLDPVGIDAADASLSDEVSALVEIRRMAGVDVELGRPSHVALDIVLNGCVESGYLRPHVERQLQEVFASGLRPDGRRGFFHPDRFTFGQPLWLSDVIAAAMGVDGLASAVLQRFTRADASFLDAHDSLAAGVIPMGAREVLCCASDLNDPESGRIRFDLGGGS